MNVGLYQISIGNYFYVGQSSDLRKRKGQHLSMLENGTHYNRFLQNVYNKHQDFHFQETLFCPVEELDAQEQRLLDMLCGTEGCMNIASDVVAPARGLKHSEESKKRISDANRGAKNPAYGRTGKAHPMYNHTKYIFVHDEHGEVTCTTYELRKKYNLNHGHLSAVASAKRKSHGGWRIKK